MKYNILGPRVLIKVQKIKYEDFIKEKGCVEGSTIIQAVMKTERELKEEFDIKIGTQTQGTVVKIGPTVHSTLEGFSTVKEGDVVHFQRYGAVRLHNQETDDCEYWIVNGKDLLCVEEA